MTPRREFFLGMTFGTFGIGALGGALFSASLMLNELQVLPFAWRYGIGPMVAPIVLDAVVALSVIIRWWPHARPRALGTIAGLALLLALPALGYAALLASNVQLGPR